MQKIKSGILTVGTDQLECFLVSVETVIKKGLFQFEIIGLANKTISESKQRILSALDHTLQSKNKYIHKKITTLLSPAGIKKEGSHFDLPIAVSYIVSNQGLQKIHKTNAPLWNDIFTDVVILGELTLTGSILPIHNIHMLIDRSIEKGISHFIIPKGNDLHFIKSEIYIWEVGHISEILEVIQNTGGMKTNIRKSALFKMHRPRRNRTLQEELGKDKTYLLDSIQGNTLLKRALLIALAGKHHFLIVGEPGSGKSVLAKAARELLPNLDVTDMNITQIEYFLRENNSPSVKNQISIPAPFREPHHTTSYSDIIGNKNIPGEILLAHKGILFIDEFSEVNKRVIEGLRQPLEDKYLQRNQGDLIESDFILIASMNPCDCGFYKSKNKPCICANSQIAKFIRKVNSPLFQRFDIYINSNVCIKSKLGKDEKSDNIRLHTELKGEDVCENILRVQKTQNDRVTKLYNENQKMNVHAQNISPVFKNKDYLTSLRKISLLLDHQNETHLGEEGKRLLNEISTRFYFSKREQSSLLRVARTISDIEESALIRSNHILEALSLKNKRE